MTDPADVPSLLTEAGQLFSSTDIPALLSQAELREVERELRAQVEVVLDCRLAPTHLGWHCLADDGRPDVLELTRQLAVEYRLAARVWLAPARHQARSRGRAVVDRDFVDSFSLDLPGKAERYAALRRALPAGLSEWAVHPRGVDERGRENRCALAGSAHRR